MVKKKHTLQNILKFQKVKFEYLHSYIWILIWIKIIDQFKMIAKMLWPLIQVLCNRCSILIKSRSCHNSTKKALWFFFYRDVTAFHQVHSPHVITKNAETHPPPMHDAIIKQPLRDGPQILVLILNEVKRINWRLIFFKFAIPVPEKQWCSITE